MRRGAVPVTSRLQDKCTEKVTNPAGLPGRPAVWRMVGGFVLWVMTVYGAPSPELTVMCSKSSYCRNDTVILAIQIRIPDGYVLIGNPKGPGVGRSLKLRISSNDHSIRWLEVRKPPAKKYGPPFGEWVWTYSGNVCFFCTGVVSPDTGRILSSTYSGTVLFEGLLCSSECRLETRTLPFTLAIDDNRKVKEHFVASADLFRIFTASRASMPLDSYR